MAGIVGNLKTFDDYRRAEEEFQLKKREKEAEIEAAKFKMQNPHLGQNTPAALQLADKYAEARAKGDTQRMHDIEQFAKIVDRGVVSSPDGGYVSVPGYDELLAQRKGLVSGADEQAKQQQKTIYEPNREEDIAQRKANITLQYEPQTKAAVTAADLKSKAKTEAQINLQKTENQAEQALQLIESIGKDPGLPAVVGAPNPLKGRIPFVGNIMGSPAADFQAKLDQLGGKNFLEAYEALKGGGAITGIEGEKGTNAIARMQTSQSEKAFREALSDLESVVRKGVERTRVKAGVENIPLGGNINIPGIEKPSLKTISPTDPRIKAAREAGYTEQEIINYLGSNK